MSNHRASMHFNSRRASALPASFAPPDTGDSSLPLHFNDCFWNPSSSHDYRTGYNVLKSKVAQGTQELYEIIAFYRDFIQVEQDHANRLESMALPKLQSENGESLSYTFNKVRSEMQLLGQCHKQLCENLELMVLGPLERFSDERDMSTKESQIRVERTIGHFEHYHVETKRAKDYYVQKCKEADEEERKLPEAKAKRVAARRKSSGMSGIGLDDSIMPPQPTFRDTEKIIAFGPLEFNEEELEEFLSCMHEQIPIQEIRTLLSSYTGVSGSDVADWLMVMYPDLIDDVDVAEVTAQEMLDSGFLAPTGRSREFDASPDVLYQWTQHFLDTCEPSYKRVRKEAMRAEEEYRQSTKNAESYRLLVEEQLMLFFTAMEYGEHERLKCIKIAFESMSVTLSNVISFSQAQYDRLMLDLDVFRPMVDNQNMMAKQRTGAFVPQVIHFEDVYGLQVREYVFGLALDMQFFTPGEKVPQIVLKMLSAIRKASADVDVEEKREMWIEPMELTTIHALRGDINHYEKIHMRQLRKYSLPVIIGCLRLFLLELPECIMTYSMYDAFKGVYDNPATADQSKEERIASLRTLISGLPTVHFHTLQAIMSHVHTLVDDLSVDDPYVGELTQSLSAAFIRPVSYKQHNVKDTHAQRVLVDMVHAYPIVFAPMHRLSDVSLGEFRSDGSLSNSLSDDQTTNSKANTDNWGRFSDDDSDVWDSDDSDMDAMTTSETAYSRKSRKRAMSRAERGELRDRRVERSRSRSMLVTSSTEHIEVVAQQDF